MQLKATKERLKFDYQKLASEILGITFSRLLNYKNISCRIFLVRK